MSSRALVFIPGLAVGYYDCREHCSIHRIVYIENVFHVPNSGINLNQSVS